MPILRELILLIFKLIGLKRILFVDNNLNNNFQSRNKVATREISSSSNRVLRVKKSPEESFANWRIPGTKERFTGSSWNQDEHKYRSNRGLWWRNISLRGISYQPLTKEQIGLSKMLAFIATRGSAN